MRVALQCAVILAWTALLPTVAFAQASITGTVKDTSGAVLPGVTVEAASPVLIEKVRESVTDANGRFQIVDLRPGTYTVTFSLAGFNSVKRDGVALSGSSAINVDAELLKWGAAVSSTLRAMSNAQRSSLNRSGVRKSSVYGSYSYSYDPNYNYYYNVRSTGSQKAQISMEEMASANAARFQGWKGIEDSVLPIRQKMTKTYGVEF